MVKLIVLLIIQLEFPRQPCRLASVTLHDAKKEDEPSISRFATTHLSGRGPEVRLVQHKHRKIASGSFVFSFLLDSTLSHFQESMDAHVLESGKVKASYRC
ncbi:hypothetical protein DL546_005509 [Coniochaeta pulveracea]|uniref:Uncharacterized protein n=1 Tax=Coniochaeta pulveracea TaxID=177199 RepID=A0A420YAN1_9PEZI|nr:hypothetical protein DL546_005509 [Coniochaeta pulveracea]